MKEKKSDKRAQKDLEKQLFFLEEEDLGREFLESRTQKKPVRNNPNPPKRKPAPSMQRKESRPVPPSNHKPTKKELRVKKKAEKKALKERKAYNKEFARVTYFFVALFLVLMGYIVYFNLVRAKDIISSPYNTRQDSFADRVVRGMILDKDGKVLALTHVEEDGSEWREYPYGSTFAHVVGYSVKGKSGLEATSNFELLTSNAFFLDRIKNQLQDQKNIGDNIVTTLDGELQQVAYQALGNNFGAVVVMETSTGKILTMVNKPSFDPNTVSADWEALNDNQDGIFVNRVTQGRYAPGSTFKVVTALQYIREHPHDYMNYSYECTGEISAEGTTIRCANDAVHGTVNLESSLAYSCNTSFANIGLLLSMDSFQETAKDLLFNTKLPSDLLYNQSSFTLDSNATKADRMMTAFGQGNSLVSPYHMAMITSAIANGGQLMRPYLVDSVVNNSGSTVKKNRPERYRTLMSSEEALILSQYMTSVVDYGTATYLGRNGYSMAGKTGTAEYSMDKEKTHSWFMGFTNVENPDIAIAVLIEGSDVTGSTAIATAREVCDAYYY